jgi:hypothetical protein
MAENPSQLVERVRRLVERRGAREVRRGWLVPAAGGVVLLIAAAVPGVAATTAIPGPSLLWDQGADTLRPRKKLEALGALPQLDVNRIADRAAAKADRAMTHSGIDVQVDSKTIRDGVRQGLKDALSGTQGAESALDTVGIAALIAALRASVAGVRRAAAHS